jgi:uncharacterized protein YkwD
MPGFGNIRTFAATAFTRRLRVGGLALVLSLLTVAASASPTFAWGSAAFSPTDEKLLFSLTNQDRASAGLNALVNDTYLHKEAEWRAKDMGDRDYFSHKIPPSGNMVFTYMQKDGYCFNIAGENIGLSNYGDDIATASIEKAFMGSTGHRANILGKWYRLGVGAYKAAERPDSYYAVLFSIPCGSRRRRRRSRSSRRPRSRPRSPATPTAEPTAGTHGRTDRDAEPSPSVAPSALPDGGLGSPEATTPPSRSASVSGSERRRRARSTLSSR